MSCYKLDKAYAGLMPDTKGIFVGRINRKIGLRFIEKRTANGWPITWVDQDLVTKVTVVPVFKDSPTYKPKKCPGIKTPMVPYKKHQKNGKQLR